MATGRYQSTSEVVREAVRLLEDQQLRREVELAQARAMIQEGAEQLERGETIDADSFFTEWDTELDALEAPNGQSE